MSESHHEPIIPPPEPLPPPDTAENDKKLAEFLAEFADVTNVHQRAFLAGFAIGKGIKAAQRLSGVHWRSHYRWLAEDVRYGELFDLVRALLADEAEEEAYRRAFLGYETPLHYHGKIKSWYKSYSDALAVFLLKGMKPERYGRHADELGPRPPSAIEITIKKEGEETAAPAAPEFSIPCEEEST